MRLVSRMLMLVVGLAAIALAPTSRAAVIVFDNRDQESVPFQLTAMQPTPLGDADNDSPWKPYGKPLRYELASGGVLPIPVLGTVRINFGTDTPRQYLLDPNTVCYFSSFNGALDIEQIGFTHDEEFAATQSNATSRSGLSGEDDLAKQRRQQREIAMCPTAVIPVKILADDNEVTRPELWQKRLSDRLAAASEIFERHARIRFEVVAFDTWKSNDTLDSFPSSLRELEREARASPAQLVIGFTSQYNPPTGTRRLGGTFGPFRTHILIREWHNHISEAERLEVLVHELGHYFGATHSPEPTSVMRPKLGDRQSRRQDFRIRFDPLNTLLLYLVGEEIRYRGIDRLSQVSPPTKQNLRDIYAELARGFPEDNAAGRMLQFLYAPAGRLPGDDRQAAGRVDRTRRVVKAVRRAVAAELSQLGKTEPATNDREANTRRMASAEFGDRLAEICLRAAAVEAAKLPKSRQVEAFLLGIGLALDRPGHLRRHPMWLQQFKTFEQEDLEVLNVPRGIARPTINGREDLLLHFTYSAALSALIGTRTTEMVGLLKELGDARGGSGFSFDDYAANLSGIALARRLKLVGSIPEKFARNVKLTDVFPGLDGLPQSLDLKALYKEFGVPEDDRFREQRSEIMARIMELPAYSTGDLGIARSSELSP